MKVKDDIEHALEDAVKEVRGWPEWVRSADVRAEFKRIDRIRAPKPNKEAP